MGNILNHNRLPFDFRLNKSEYWDFYLSQPSYGTTDSSEGLSDKCLISYIDTTDPECMWAESLYSKPKYFWNEAVNKGVILKNIGYTGVDNGLIHYLKDRISNEEFIKLFKKSEFKIKENDLRLLLNKVYGNNQIFNFDNDLVEEDGMIVSKLNGGFWQGFFRANEDYKVLPKNIGNGLTFEVVLKKHEFENDGKYRLNDRHKDNKGMFLYLGTRAENKWWKEYILNYKPIKIENGFITSGYVKSEYTTEDSLNDNYIKAYKDLYAVDEYFADGYLTDRCDKNCCCDTNTSSDSSYFKNSSMPKFTYPEYLNTYEDNSVWFDQGEHLWIENEVFTTRQGEGGGYHKTKRKCNCDQYFADDYITKDYYGNSCDCTIYFKEDYLKPETKIDENEELFMSDGYTIRHANIREYRSDNKFLLFDRTCDGFTTDNWVEGSEVVITDVMTPKITNYFLLFNRTCNGYTTNNIDSLIDEEAKKYNILDDLYRNALGFQIDENGRVGYKYLVKDCEGDEGYKILSEWSFENVVKEDKWSTIAIQLQPIGRKYDDCVKNTSSYDKMKIVVYVDGKLRLISKELSTLNFRNLNDSLSKQEGVPFNISLGGGTQGLSDVIYLNYRKLPEYELPLEKAFAGTFIGYVKALRIYNCNILFSGIRQNVDFDQDF